MRCGDFRETYAEDMALFESPLRRGSLLAGLLAFLLALPQFATTYWLDVAEPHLHRHHRRGRPQRAHRLHRPDLARQRRLPGGGRLRHRRPGRQGRPPLRGGDPALRAASPPLVGMVFGIPSLRLKGLYLAVATLAAHFIVEFTVTHWESRDRRRERHLASRPPSSPASSSRTTGGIYYLILPGHGRAALLHQEPLPHQGGQGLRGHPRPGHLRRGHGGERLPLQAALLRGLQLPHRRGRLAARLPGPHHQPGELPHHAWPSTTWA